MPLYVDIVAVPSSGKTQLLRDKTGRIKCYLKSPPEKGKANKELIQLIAKLLSLTQKEVIIAGGETDRKKRICIDKPMTMEEFCSRCGIVLQTTLGR